MKRNKQSSRTMRTQTPRRDTRGNSRYARKLNAGNQMYGGRGPLSCCAHRIKIAGWPY